MAHCAIDIDGTAAAAPQQIQELASALMAAAHRVTIITGIADDIVTQEDFDEKSQYLCALGMAESYNDMVVISNNVKGGLAKAKAMWCKNHGVDILIDNNKENAKAAISYVPLVLVPWATRV